MPTGFSSLSIILGNSKGNGKKMTKAKNKMNFTSLEALTDEIYGKKGTPRRDEMEARLEKEVKNLPESDTVDYGDV